MEISVGTVLENIIYKDQDAYVKGKYSLNIKDKDNLYKSNKYNRFDQTN